MTCPSPPSRAGDTGGEVVPEPLAPGVPANAVAKIDKAQRVAERRRAQDPQRNRPRDRDNAARTSRPTPRRRSREVLRAHETGGLLAVLYSHLDGLENKQDRGDVVAVERDMAEIVSFLRPFFNPYDIIIRMSSEQFLCVLTGCDSPRPPSGSSDSHGVGPGDTGAGHGTDRQTMDRRRWLPVRESESSWSRPVTVKRAIPSRTGAGSCGYSGSSDSLAVSADARPGEQR